MAITAVRRGDVGVRFRGSERGYMFALLPEPVDADACLSDAGFTAFADSDEKWDEDFDAIVTALIRVLEKTFGEPSVVAPTRSVEPRWWGRLSSFLLFQRSASNAAVLNPGRLSPIAALTSAAHDDSYLEFASVEFGRSSDRCDAISFASDGHPILWIWLRGEGKEEWPALSQAAAGNLPCTDVSIAWDSLVPTRPVFSLELPRVSFHRGDTASWTDGTRRLGFNAGLGVSPPEVYVPTAQLWNSSVPQWAATLRSTIIDDLRKAGAAVVELENAATFGPDEPL